MKDPEDEAFEELALKQGQWHHVSGWRKKQIEMRSSEMPPEPQWLTNANREKVLYGQCLVLFRIGIEPTVIPIDQYDELKQAMTWIQNERKFRTKEIDETTKAREQ